ncbi:MAG: hypothetical protein AAF928_19320 [Myxococcota bacterium]
MAIDLGRAKDLDRLVGNSGIDFDERIPLPDADAVNALGSNAAIGEKALEKARTELEQAELDWMEIEEKREELEV